MPKKLEGEFGRTGQYRFGGLFYDEFLSNLQGLRGIRVYQEMSENDGGFVKQKNRQKKIVKLIKKPQRL